MIGLSVFGIGRAVRGLKHPLAFGHRGQQALGVHRTHTPGHGAVLRERIAQPVAHHGVAARTVSGAEICAHGGKGCRAVEIIRVQHGEGRVLQLRRGGQHRMGRSPGLDSALGRREALRQLPQVLIDIGHRDMGRHTAAHLLLEGFAHLFLDDEYHPAESGRNGIVDREIHQKMPLGIHWRHLLESAEPAAHTGSHNDQCWIVHAAPSSRVCPKTIVSYCRSESKSLSQISFPFPISSGLFFSAPVCYNDIRRHPRPIRDKRSAAHGNRKAL